MDLSIVVPCCNEAENVPKLAAELMPVAAALARTQSVEVVFVDDGSTDGTLAALQAAFGAGRTPAGVSVRFEQHPVNRGLGAAMRTGFAAAAGAVVASTDADGTYKFETLPALLACLTPEVDIVTASPYHPAGGVKDVPEYRLVLSQGASFLYRLLVEWRLHTWTCLYRAYRREVLQTIQFASTGFLAGTELLVKALLAGYRVAEYPAVLHSRVAGQSKAKVARIISAHLGFQWQVILHRLKLKPMAGINRGSGDRAWKPLSQP
ncbi:MAG: glycosyltransferase family 2 protein [Anaerolineales bacterium]|nr:glycosyltransferase family 2 protein [Anaerolineales bacterium]